ncbi:MAG: methylated-DNA--[protein]-cysteine S-methyltransferase [Acidimicrobiia bacterium]|nr:methylated-DNA--[protein]-cysteine S-methyltransferase [Acidimicrobiia bacterium]MYC57057.1 methylated-DNA--[protein]-cysteine S-methyltransferase [Acidimicrobiia bacterium]MYG93664.1 methylated-DNA--[protein]-cysteine S-methyltransferase [Acidimicrobiia bacterium]MYI30134.1 methylated-DNA--[protein]-cysteine S-methyltransferase [Acidimicrobiia bacterium]
MPNQLMPNQSLNLVSSSEHSGPNKQDFSSEVAFGGLDTPIGRLNLAATSKGLLRVGFTAMQSAEDFVANVVGLTNLSNQGEATWLNQPASQLGEYFEGSRKCFELKLDWRLSHGFYAQVLKALLLVDYGTTISYGELARMAGSANAARAVGTAMSTNSLALVVPCHRVIRSDGTVGEYAGRPEIKAWLVAHELAHR